MKCHILLNTSDTPFCVGCLTAYNVKQRRKIIMILQKYINENRKIALCCDVDKLPDGDWKQIGTVDAVRGENRIGASSDEILDAIEDNGYFSS